MKKIILICVINLFVLSAPAQTKLPGHQFILNGKIAGQPNGYISLRYTNEENKFIKDSCALQNGNFYFKGIIRQPTLVTLKLGVKSITDDDPNSVGFWIEPGKITAALEYNHFKSAKINGSKTQKEFELWENAMKGININDSFQINACKADYRFVNTHPDSYVSSFVLVLDKSRCSLDSVRKLYGKLNPAIQKSKFGKEVKETISAIDNSAPGKSAKNFITTDINNKPISLYSFKGKYVLLDFWASWCVPCRESTPHIKELFKKYHGQGLEIIGISEDDKTEDWKNAVAKDGVNIWYNILSWPENDIDAKADNLKWISTKFGVQVLPTKFLIDKNGIIIGRYNGTDEEAALNKRLREIFSK